MPREDNVAVEFYVEPVRDAKASAEKGYEIFTEVEMCHIVIVGDRDNDLRIRATEPAFKRPGGGAMMNAIERYPDHYTAFKRNETEAVSGTPLSHLPFLGKAQIAELQFHGVKTGEQLAGLGEAAVADHFGWREWRTKAQVWLDDTDKSALAAKSALENERLLERLAALEKQIEAQKPLKAKAEAA